MLKELLNKWGSVNEYPDMQLSSTRPSSSSAKLVILGVCVILSVFLVLGSWAAVAPLARSIAAGATLTVKGERKKIQHFEGGIVKKIHVAVGQRVKNGDPLVALDPLETDASYQAKKSEFIQACLLYTSPSPRDLYRSRMPSSA